MLRPKRPLARFAAALLTLPPLLVLPLAPVVARAPAQDPAEWLYAGSDIPRDSEWQFGILPNGVRYAVRKNGVPPGQVAIRVRIDAGSLNERDEERGFAHLIEHLAFRGSKHVPDGEAKRIWQRFGVTFGSDSNAQTTPTQTVYQLDLPNVTRANLDEGVKILAGMVRDPQISDAAVAAERAVVLAELRENSGPQKRIADALNAHLFAGQRLAGRSPIGTPETLGAATASALSTFHRRWYRPDRTVVTIVGDIPAAELAGLVARHFGDWRGQGKAERAPDFGKPDPAAPAILNIVEPGQPPAMTLAYIRPWKPTIDTVANTRRLYMEYLALALVNRRLENRARAGGSFLVATIEQQYVSRSADVTFAQIVPLDDWQTALQDVRRVIADALATPPSQSDIDREANEIEAFLAKELDNARNEPGARLADDLIRAVDIGETVTSPKAQVSMFADIRKAATPDAMLAATRAMFDATVTRLVVTTPEPVAGGNAALQAALIQPVQASADDRLAQLRVDPADLVLPAPAGTVVSEERLPFLRAERIELSNGVTALVSNNRVEPGKVRVNVRFGTGYRSVSPGAANLLWTGAYALVASGVGPWGQNELDQFGNGRQIQLNFSVDDDAFELAGETSPADLTDQLRLITAKLWQPRWDAAPVARLRIGMLTGYDVQFQTPTSVLERDLEGWVRGGDHRWTAPDRQEIEALTPTAFQNFWEPRLASGPIEVQLFGDLSGIDYKVLLAQTFGALPRREALTAPDGETSPLPRADTVPELRFHRGDRGQAAALMAWPTAGGLNKIKEGRALDIVSAIMADRLFDRLRAADGASYGPFSDSHFPTAFTRGGYIMVGSLLAPGDVDRFLVAAREIAADLVANPVSDDELARAVGPLREQIARASTGNMFWMMQLEGATRDPRIARAALTLETEMGAITAKDVQEAAQAYLRPDGAASLVVLPQGMTLAEAAASPSAGNAARAAMQ